MALEFSICEVRWERYRRVSENPHAREWLEFQAARGLAANTIEAYGRDLDCYLGFLETEDVPFHSVIRPTIGAYIRSITQLEVPRVSRKGVEARSTLANATLQQHLTVVRLFHDFLVEERVCTRNPLRPPIGGRGLIHRSRTSPAANSAGGHEEPTRKSGPILVGNERDVQQVSPKAPRTEPRTRSAVPIRVLSQLRKADLDLDLVQDNRSHRRAMQSSSIYATHPASSVSHRLGEGELGHSRNSDACRSPQYTDDHALHSSERS
jgi:hypothetical protein